MWLEFFECFCVIIFASKFIAMLTMGRCKSKRRIDDKIVLITGGNGGIGKEITRDLAMRGARIIMGCRNLVTANEVKDQIENETGNMKITIIKLDLGSLSSVREFASEVCKTEPHIDILIHCAGIYTFGLEKQITDEGVDISIATNHLGSFLLTHLLIDLMKKSESGRIIVISSILRFLSYKNFAKINFKNSWKGNHVSRYGTSKYANMLFTKELAKRLEGTGITANCLHPGIVMTNMVDGTELWYYYIIRALQWFFKTTEEGAQTTIHLAVSNKVAQLSGKFFIDCYPFNIPSWETDNAVSLWKVSEELVNLKDSEKTI